LQFRLRASPTTESIGSRAPSGIDLRGLPEIDDQSGLSSVMNGWESKPLA